ncbi:GvpL/GvpF family gas vesicle protein, partial [Streptomyces sp. NPDC035033]|uniref:GvpL/GvpF family gas vesicle protein n=1 Tax=Streptomyces sp. NPDC035033 TaxID=3155368 RepID=UPI0033F48DAC
MTGPDDRVVYVYAVVAGTAPLRDRLAGLRGVADAPVELLPEAGTEDRGGAEDRDGTGGAEDRDGTGGAADGGGDGTGGAEGRGGTGGAAGGGGEAPGRLAFVTSAVPRDDFGEAALARRFEDLAWLEQVARAHHDVVRAVAAHATVLPLRMATLYEDGARAGRVLAERHDTFARRLALLHAHAEYGVKVSLPPASGGGARVGARRHPRPGGAR